MSKRRIHSHELGTSAAMKAIYDQKTAQKIADDHAIHPIPVSRWKRQLQDGASELFTRIKNENDIGERHAKEAELFQQIDKLQMELGWLK